MVAFHAVSSAVGSSPRTRGTPIWNASIDLKVRLIPADAGNTVSMRWCRSRVGAHPRGRGEHARRRPTRPRCPGLIPADAGNTESGESSPWLDGAHPRGRGQHVGDGYYGFPVLGSSPRTRGTPNAEHVLRGMTGLIPAAAGNTVSLRWCRSRVGAHPRGRGEHRKRRKLSVA